MVVAFFNILFCFFSSDISDSDCKFAIISFRDVGLRVSGSVWIWTTALRIREQHICICSTICAEVKVLHQMTNTNPRNCFAGLGRLVSSDPGINSVKAIIMLLTNSRTTFQLFQ